MNEIEYTFFITWYVYCYRNTPNPDERTNTMYDQYKQIGWDKSGSVWYKECSGFLYQIHPAGEHCIAYKFQYFTAQERVGAIVARYLASDRQTAQAWADTHCDIDTDPWDNTPEAKADHETARQRLQELHELEKEQDRYRVYG